ncbi:MAG: hypothetical protein HZA50_10920 [Planctomycetes bacterium]|nr:hypothetical protein [Planctomycetota bacterium]
MNIRASLAIVAAALAAGCSQAPPGTSRDLSTNDRANAYVVCRDVLTQYFSVETDDPQAGIMKSRPKDIVAAKGERLLGNSPARQIATLSLRKEGGSIVAYVCIETQRQGSDPNRQMGYASSVSDNYSGVPNQTPAQSDAATTAEQNESWRTVDYDHVQENKILNEISKAVQSPARPEKPTPPTPSTQPK